MLSTNEKNAIERESGFRPVFIGTTPGGSEWFAYKPEDVEGLKASLARLWEKHEQKQSERKPMRSVRQWLASIAPLAPLKGEDGEEYAERCSRRARKLAPEIDEAAPDSARYELAEIEDAVADRLGMHPQAPEWN
jgi:hypothetical protein